MQLTIHNPTEFTRLTGETISSLVNVATPLYLEGEVTLRDEHGVPIASLTSGRVPGVPAIHLSRRQYDALRPCFPTFGPVPEIPRTDRDRYLRRVEAAQAWLNALPPVPIGMLETFVEIPAVHREICRERLARGFSLRDQDILELLREPFPVDGYAAFRESGNVPADVDGQRIDAEYAEQRAHEERAEAARKRLEVQQANVRVKIVPGETHDVIEYAGASGTLPVHTSPLVFEGSHTPTFTRRGKRFYLHAVIPGEAMPRGESFGPGVRCLGPKDAFEARPAEVMRAGGSMDEFHLMRLYEMRRDFGLIDDGPVKHAVDQGDPRYAQVDEACRPLVRRFVHAFTALGHPNLRNHVISSVVRGYSLYVPLAAKLLCEELDLALCGHKPFVVGEPEPTSGNKVFHEAGDPYWRDIPSISSQRWEARRPTGCPTSDEIVSMCIESAQGGDSAYCRTSPGSLLSSIQAEKAANEVDPLGAAVSFAMRSKLSEKMTSDELVEHLKSEGVELGETMSSAMWGRVGDAMRALGFELKEERRGKKERVRVWRRKGLVGRLLGGVAS